MTWCMADNRPDFSLQPVIPKRRRTSTGSAHIVECSFHPVLCDVMESGIQSPEYTLTPIGSSREAIIRQSPAPPGSPLMMHDSTGAAVQLVATDWHGDSPYLQDNNNRAQCVEPMGSSSHTSPLLVANNSHSGGGQVCARSKQRFGGLLGQRKRQSNQEHPCRRPCVGNYPCHSNGRMQPEDSHHNMQYSNHASRTTTEAAPAPPIQLTSSVNGLIIDRNQLSRNVHPEMVVLSGAMPSNAPRVMHNSTQSTVQQFQQDAQQRLPIPLHATSLDRGDVERNRAAVAINEASAARFTPATRAPQTHSANGTTGPPPGSMHASLVMNAIGSGGSMDRYVTSMQCSSLNNRAGETTGRSHEEFIGPDCPTHLQSMPRDDQAYSVQLARPPASHVLHTPHQAQTEAVVAAAAAASAAAHAVAAAAQAVSAVVGHHRPHDAAAVANRRRGDAAVAAAAAAAAAYAQGSSTPVTPTCVTFTLPVHTGPPLSSLMLPQESSQRARLFSEQDGHSMAQFSAAHLRQASASMGTAARRYSVAALDAESGMALGLPVPQFGTSNTISFVDLGPGRSIGRFCHIPPTPVPRHHSPEPMQPNGLTDATTATIGYCSPVFHPNPLHPIVAPPPAHLANALPSASFFAAAPFASRSLLLPPPPQAAQLTAMAAVPLSSVHHTPIGPYRVTPLANAAALLTNEAAAAMALNVAVSQHAAAAAAAAAAFQVVPGERPTRVMMTMAQPFLPSASSSFLTPAVGAAPMALSGPSLHHMQPLIPLIAGQASNSPTVAALSTTRDVQTLFQFLRLINQGQDPYSLPYYPSAMTATAGGSHASVVVSASAGASHGTRVAAAVTPPLAHHHPTTTTTTAMTRPTVVSIGPPPGLLFTRPPTNTPAPVTSSSAAVALAAVAMAAATVMQQQQQHHHHQQHHNRNHLPPTMSMLATPRAALPTPSIPVPILHAHLYCPTTLHPVTVSPHPPPPCYHSHYVNTATVTNTTATSIPQLHPNHVHHPGSHGGLTTGHTFGSPAYLANLFPFLLAVPSPSSMTAASHMQAHDRSMGSTDSVDPTSAAAAAVAAAAAAAAASVDQLYQLAVHLEASSTVARTRGLNEDELNSLPLHWHAPERIGHVALHESLSHGATAAKSSGVVLSATDERCMICLDDYAMRDCVRTMRCRHEFHAKCVDKWLKTKRTCPLCRADAFDGTHGKEELI